MRGLLVKDIKLLKNQKNVLFVILVVYSMFLATAKDYGGMVAYVTFMCSLLSLTTITYDEFDNGMSFIFTLPITRRLYVKEKYLFSASMIFVVWFVTSLLTTVLMMIRHMPTPVNEWLAELPIYFFFGLACMMLMLPLQLKFGAEKRMIAFAGVFMVAAMVALLFTYLNHVMQIDFEELWEKVEMMPAVGIVGILAILCLIAGIISYNVSVKIIEKREY